MTLYDLIKKVSLIITPETDAFYEYVLHTSDNNGGFLRTRYCWWDSPVNNFDLGDRHYNKVLVTMKAPFVEENLCKRPDTLAKIQFDYGETDAMLSDADWDAELGYNYVYLFDLNNSTYEMIYKESPYQF